MVIAVCAAHSFLVGDAVVSFTEEIPTEQTLEQLTHCMRQGDDLYDLHFPNSSPLLAVDDGIYIASSIGV